LLVMLVVGGGFARGELYKRGWVGQAVLPGAYFSGMLAWLGALELASTGAAVGLWVTGQVLLCGLPGAAAGLMLVCSWPDGRVMEVEGADG
jgi:hypothetical protein